ncbi:Fc.00g103120.m01.CDS01 [Cosmosporella sp. VM-42]
MADFDPFTQNVTFFGPDGKTEITVPIPALNAFHAETASICINYGTQIGACLIMLLTVLVMTPSSKFRRLSNILHIAGLVVCTIRMGLLAAYYPSPFNDFYTYWGYDYSRVPRMYFHTSVASTVFSLFLVICVEGALMNQAWAMVSLWPKFWKWGISISSAIISLNTIGWRIAFTVFQVQSIYSLVPAAATLWVAYGMVVTNAISICWFCAIFNIKLIMHLVSNRGLLPSYKNLTPMEVLVMTNGILMIVPVIFSGLEWSHLAFEAASLTLTSVALILPLGTLAAQRMSHVTSFALNSADSNCHYNGVPNTGTCTSSMKPLKTTSFSTNRTGTTAQASVFSRCEAGMTSRDRINPMDMELGKFQPDLETGERHIQVDRNFSQHEERI